MTGLVPHRNGAEGFEPINDGITLLTELLAADGYRLGILGKVDHIAPVERFGWDYIRTMAQLGLGRDPERYGAATEEFLAEAGDDPWFLMANAHDPHRPFSGSAQERAKWTEEQLAVLPEPSRRVASDEFEVPGFLPDLPAVREEVADYLASVRRCDDVVGAVLQALEASGQAHETLVLFLSDNGMAFPFAKANCYLRSTLTPLIVRWPGRIEAGTVDDTTLVSSLDFFPTFCDALGLPAPADLDGLSLRELLEAGEPLDRDTMFTVFHETSARRRFEMRCAQDRDYGYIWNEWVGEGRSYVAENMAGETWNAMREAANTSAEVEARVGFYLGRAREELYDLRADPYGLHNLAGEGDYAEVLADFRGRLLGWMLEHGDPQLKRYRAQVLATG
jgi:N-sulfoglucosamine sulfohydrolase